MYFLYSVALSKIFVYQSCPSRKKVWTSLCYRHSNMAFRFSLFDIHKSTQDWTFEKHVIPPNQRSQPSTNVATTDHRNAGYNNNNNFIKARDQNRWPPATPLRLGIHNIFMVFIYSFRLTRVMTDLLDHSNTAYRFM